MGLILLDRALLSKSLIQFSVDGWGCVSSLLSDLGPNYGGGHEGNGDFLQKVPCRPCPCTQSPTLQQATVDPCLCQRLLDTHRQVCASLCGSLFLSPWSWCAQDSLYALQESISQSCVSSGSSVVGLMVTSSKRAHAISRSAAHRAPALHLRRRHSNTVLAQSLWGCLHPGAHKVCLSPLSISGG